MAEYDFAAYCNMLADNNRRDSYTRALRKVINKDSVVIDLGAGTGYFSFLAAKFGAKKVYAIETSQLINLARSFAKENSVDDKIEFIGKSSTEIELPEKADILISDLHGTLPFYGNSIASIIDARERLLEPEGLMIPVSETVWFSVVECVDFYDKHITENTQTFSGFDMSSSRSLLTDRLLNGYKQEMNLVSNTQIFAELDYRILNQTDFSTELVFEVKKDGVACGLRGWFDSKLDGVTTVTNSPDGPDSVYGAPVFPFPEKVVVKVGDILECRVTTSIKGGHFTWTWTTRILDRDENLRIEFKQSTLRGSYIQPSDILKGSEYYVPKSSWDRDVDLFVLKRFDGETPLGDIVDELIKNFPDRFASEKDAFDRVYRLVLEYDN